MKPCSPTDLSQSLQEIQHPRISSYVILLLPYSNPPSKPPKIFSTTLSRTRNLPLTKISWLYPQSLYQMFFHLLPLTETWLSPKNSSTQNLALLWGVFSHSTARSQGTERCMSLLEPHCQFHSTNSPFSLKHPPADITHYYSFLQHPQTSGSSPQTHLISCGLKLPDLAHLWLPLLQWSWQTVTHSGSRATPPKVQILLYDLQQII